MSRSDVQERDISIENDRIRGLLDFYVCLFFSILSHIIVRVNRVSKIHPLNHSPSTRSRKSGFFNFRSLTKQCHRGGSGETMKYGVTGYPDFPFLDDDRDLYGSGYGLETRFLFNDG